jgi:hypothetical membrane protein
MVAHRPVPSGTATAYMALPAEDAVGTCHPDAGTRGSYQPARLEEDWTEAVLPLVVAADRKHPDRVESRNTGTSEEREMASRTIPKHQTRLVTANSEPARPEAAARRRSRDAGIAGVLLSLSGVAILMGFVTAEALFPGIYTTHANTVSHLGASEPPNSVVPQPSAAIFDLTMLVTGAMIALGACFAYRALRRKAVLIPTALLGVGVFGVGVFPLTNPTPHTLFSFTAFLAGGIAMLLSARVTRAPFRHLWSVLGIVALVATALALDAFRAWAPMAELGEGGLERWIVYPVVLWLVAFGSYLMATPAARPGKEAGAHALASSTTPARVTEPAPGGE